MGDPKGFLKVKRQAQTYRPVCERIKDYAEAAVLQPDKHSQEQASRCMDCGIPFCHWGCPVGNYIPEWNDLLFRGKWQRGFEILQATNNFPEITGRLCPAPCEFSCVLGINDDPVTIKEDELAIIEHGFKSGLIKAHPPQRRTGKKIAVVGSGPAGLAAADQLNKAGHTLTVFEKDDRLGGILRFGIPDFKLEKWVLDRRLKILEKEGVKFRTNLNVLNILNADSRKSNADGRRFYLRVSACNLRKSALRDILLKDKFDAVCLAGGSRIPRDLKIEGRDLKGIYFAMDYLTQANRRAAGEKIAKEKIIDAKDKRVIVLGGGDTGADCVGVAHRQGASCVVQIELLPQPPECRSQDYPWPKYPMLLKTSSSHEEGGQRQWSVLTKKFIGENGKVKKLSCVKVEFQNDSKGCGLMREVKNSEFEIEADLVILALGFLHPQKEGLLKDLGVALDAKGNVQTDANFMTSVKNVFSCADMRRGQSLIVWAIAEGRQSAYHIDKYLMGESYLPII